MPRYFGVKFAFSVFLALCPTFVSAQTGTIGGVIRDTSGGILPGVTVEAASPALIEKVRSAVTDSRGVYQIVDLRPGVYSVTFTLPGFRTVRREGVELSAGFVANLSVELEVGTVEETITVIGQSPLVDIQSTTQHRTMSERTIEDLPTAKQWQHLAVFIPGVQVASAAGAITGQDVGGSSGQKQMIMAVHGSRAGEMPNIFDGMRHGSPANTGGGVANVWAANPAMVAEISIDTSGAGADAEVSGLRANTIPKSGGNEFSAYFYGDFGNDALQSNNIDTRLRDRGATEPHLTKKVWDINPAFGGPLRQDKLWFFAAYRYSGANEQPVGVYFDTNPDDFVFTPDTTRRTRPVSRNWMHSTALRLTYQATERSRLAVYGDHVPRCWCTFVGTLSASTVWDATGRLTIPTNSIYQATWNWTASSRLLVEVGETFKREQWIPQLQEGAPADRTGVTDSGIGVTFRSPLTMGGAKNRSHNGKAIVTYVTGSHNLKIGADWFSGWVERSLFAPTDMSLTLTNGVPTSITLRATPNFGREYLKLNMGIYAQDQWVFNRLTVNAGVRFDFANAYIPEQRAPAIRFVGPRQYARIDDLPNFKDISPRLGLSYDLFGDGKTALKWNLGRYMEGMGGLFAREVNPMFPAPGLATNRAWNDRNQNFIPDCDLNNPTENGECGVSLNRNFGLPIIPIRYDPDLLTGTGMRAWNWELMAGVQRELMPGMSVDVSYHRRWYGNFRLTDNLLVTAADHDPYCVTAPADSRLPKGGGYDICGLYDITPTKVGLNDNVVTFAKKFGQQTEVYDGIDYSVSARLPGGVQFQGGANTGRTATNTCFVVDSPQQLLNCDISPPFQTQVKLLGIFPLPWWAIQLSATYQSLPGPEVLATWATPVARVTGLGRPVSGGVRTVTVPLIKPGTVFGDRLHQLDFRIAKSFAAGRSRLRPQLDVYNLTNANPVLRQNNTFGANWLQPIAILAGRTVKFGVQLDF